MNIVLYHTGSIPNKVTKSLTQVANLTNAKFLEPYNEKNPTIKIKGYSNFDGVNYLGVIESNEFTRYYFIDGVVYKSPNIAIVSCSFDLLMTYKDYIKSLKALVTRTETSLSTFDVTGQQGVSWTEYQDNIPLLPKTLNVQIGFKDGLTPNFQAGFIYGGEDKQVQKNHGVYILTAMTDDWDVDHSG